MKNNKREFSKSILRIVAVAAAIIVVLAFILMWRTGDTSALAYIIPGIFAELSAATGFYYWKAKAENEIKLDMLRRKGELKNDEHKECEIEPEPGSNPGSSCEGGTI